jgi:hypothetical protein
MRGEVTNMNKKEMGWNTAKKCGHIVDIKNQPCQGCDFDEWKIFIDKYYLRRVGK